MRQVDTARGLAEVIELVECLTELLRESKAQEVGMRVSLEKEREACGAKAKRVECRGTYRERHIQRARVVPIAGAVHTTSKTDDATTDSEMPPAAYANVAQTPPVIASGKAVDRAVASGVLRRGQIDIQERMT